MSVQRPRRLVMSSPRRCASQSLQDPVIERGCRAVGRQTESGKARERMNWPPATPSCRSARRAGGCPAPWRWAASTLGRPSTRHAREEPRGRTEEEDAGPRRNSCPGVGTKPRPIRASSVAERPEERAGQVLERDGAAPGQRRPGEIAEPGADPQPGRAGSQAKVNPSGVRAARANHPRTVRAARRCSFIRAAGATTAQGGDHAGRRDGQDPCPHDAAGEAPAHGEQPLQWPDADDRAGDGRVVLTGIPPTVVPISTSAPAVSAQKPPTGRSWVMPHPHGLHDTPAAAEGAERHGGVGGEHHPERHVELGAEGSGREQQDGDDAHRLLGVVGSVARGCRTPPTRAGAGGRVR